MLQAGLAHVAAGTIGPSNRKIFMHTPPCLVWLPADHRLLGDDGDRTPYSVLEDVYARAVKNCANAQPVVFPLADGDEIPALLELVDGVLLTGSASNVHSAHFNQALADPTLPLDPQRDALTLALVHGCIERAVPLLGVCRGFQEMNVALGGSLHQQVHAVRGLMDHREPQGVALGAQYAPRHQVRFAAGSVFEAWAGAGEARVNSLHGQGIDLLARGLLALGHAPDGLVEAVAVSGANSFAYAVQWHPEWDCAENRLNAALFEAFGTACRQRRHTRRDGAAIDRAIQARSN